MSPHPQTFAQPAIVPPMPAQLPTHTFTHTHTLTRALTNIHTHTHTHSHTHTTNTRAHTHTPPFHPPTQPRTATTATAWPFCRHALCAVQTSRESMFWAEDVCFFLPVFGCLAILMPLLVYTSDAARQGSATNDTHTLTTHPFLTFPLVPHTHKENKTKHTQHQPTLYPMTSQKKMCKHLRYTVQWLPVKNSDCRR